MNERDQIEWRFRQWDRIRLQRQLTGVIAVVADSHACWMPRPNLYIEHDIGTKNIRYPNGKCRSVSVTKVRDTAGTTFYTFGPDTPLS